MALSGEHEKKLHLITQIEKRLSGIRDVDILLENILTAAREIVHADAGSIYEFDEDENILRIRYSQNDTLQKKLSPGEKLPYVSFSMPATYESISGYCALTKNVVNIPDVYNMDEYNSKEKHETHPFTFSRSNDEKTGYHTQSMLALPFTMTNGRVLGVIQIINAQDDDGNVVQFSVDDEFYIAHFTNTVGQIYEYAYLTKQLIERMIKMAGYRDPKETGAHVERVSSFAVEIYDKYAAMKHIPEGERNKFRDTLKLAAKCHDVGKVAIPDKILKKPGPLSPDERAVMQGHTCIGAQIFTPVESYLDEMARDVCLHHHAYYDGSTRGYPGKYDDYMSFEPGMSVPKGNTMLKGEEIPLAARIVSLADVYDALRHNRSYKKEWTLEDTIQEIKNQSGSQFDPELVEAFLQIIDRLEAINNAIS